MAWNTLTEFFAMGGYAFYVWGSVGATFALMAGEVVALRLRRRAALGRGGRRP